MLKPISLLFSLLLFFTTLTAQSNINLNDQIIGTAITDSDVDPINVNNIDIVRTEYGIPHIFSKTDAEAVYGIAWAQCEDGFNMMQKNFAATKGMSGRVGKEPVIGVLLDLLYQVFDIDALIEERYEKDITPEMEKLLKAYASAINKYADTYPKEVFKKNLFPITTKKVLGMYTLQYQLMHNSAMELGKLLSGKFQYELSQSIHGGSNAMAYSPLKTEDEKTYLVGNPHQPVNSIGNWWEVSVHSEEGYEMYGATFSVGGMTPVIGTNRNLGWSHTTNYQNGSDTYRLEMHPTKKNVYKYDGEWLELEKKKAKLRIKLGPVVIPLSKKYFISKYGPTIKKDNGYYAYKSHAFHSLKGPEQWYKMGKAKNMDEFKDALSLQGFPSMTITYGDKEGHIFHDSYFIQPVRDESFDWSNLLVGNTSANNWDVNNVHPTSTTPKIVDPKCGYVYNCNNTVFKMTAPEENLKPADFPKSFDLLTSNTLRAERFEDLIADYDKISFTEARKIREDVVLHKENLNFRNCMNCSEMTNLIATHPRLKSYKKVFEKWDGSYDIENKQAALFSLTVFNLSKYIMKQMGNMEKDVPEKQFLKAMKKSKRFLRRYHGGLEVELGKVQKAVRGRGRNKVEMPMYGNVNSLANSAYKRYGLRKFRMTMGDSFIFYAKYGENGLESLETVNAFGNSMKKKSPHYTDQTEIFVNKQTKNVELDLEKLRRSGEAYHPK